MPSGSSPSERRTVTILFSDLKGFTALSEGRDPEEVRELIDDLFTRLRVAIEAQGGVVDKFIGDAVMAVFGGAQAHEDDAFRAVRAGLAMQSEMAAFNRAKMLSLELRIGINSGEVVYGEIAGEKATVIGDAVNVAQRLEAACRPGGVLISSTVERATRGSIRTLKLDEIAVKGRQEHVQLYEATGLLVTDRRYRRAGQESRPMIGRERELSRLRALFETRKPGFVLIEGEAGIGKSRLIWEFHQYLTGVEDGVSWNLGHCREMGPLPMDPWAEMLRKRARVGPDEPEEASAKRIVEAVLQDLAASPCMDGAEAEQAVERENLAHLMALSIGLDVPEARVKSIPPERLGMETRHAWERWLRALADKAPVVLVVEDLHWAHPAQMEFLEHLASSINDREAGKGRMLILALTRPEGKTLEGFERLRLETLGPEDCGRIAELTLRVPAAGSLLRLLTDESGGNPYYVEELSRYLIENDLVETRSSEGAEGAVSVHLRPKSEIMRVPDSLNGLLVGRIDGLGREEKEAVKGASVVGTMFWLGVLEAALNRSADRDVRELEGREMVRRRGESELPGEVEYAFRHALLRDAAYSLLTKKDRLRLHAALGNVLEAKGTGRAKALAAGHWAEAGESERAKRLYCEASTEAMERSSWEEGLEYARRGASALLRAKALVGLARYGEALEAVGETREREGVDAEEKGRALLVAAEVYEKQGEIEGSLRAAEEVLAAGTGMAGIRKEGMRAKGVALFRLRRHDEALAVASEALDDLRGAAADEGTRRTDQKGMATNLNVIGNVYHHRGAYPEAMRAHEESLAIRRQIGDRLGIAYSLSNIGNLHHARGDYAGTMKVYEESLAILREIGDRHGIATGLNNIGNVHHARGDFAEAKRRYEESLAIRREIGDRHGIAMSLNNIGNVHQARGEHAEAIQAHEASLGINREMGDRYGIAHTLGNIGGVHHSMGEYPEAIRALEESLAIRRDIGDRSGIAHSLNNIGMVHRARGEYTGAMAAHQESLAIQRDIGDRSGMAHSLSNIGNVHYVRGEYAEAMAAHRESLAIRREIGERHGTSSSLNKIGDVHFAHGEYAEAARAQRDSLAMAREICMRALEALALRGLGEATAAAGDRTEGLAYLQQAVNLFADLGMNKEAEQARAKIADLERGHS